MRVLSFFVLSLAMTLSGCATMAHGTTQAIPITSSPEGARVLVDSVPIGVTPLVATVSRKQSHVVSFVRDSLPPVRVVMDHEVSGWTWAGLLLYGVPTYVDFKNGAAYGFPLDTLRVVFSDRSNGSARSSNIRSNENSPGSVAAAMTASAFIGLGSGQKILGARAAPFFLTQLAGGAVAMSGVALGYGGNDGAAVPLLITGFATVMVSRVWEIVDLIQIVANNGRPAGARNPASAERSVNVSFAPIVDTRSRGVGLRYTF